MNFKFCKKLDQTKKKSIYSREEIKEFMANQAKKRRIPMNESSLEYAEYYTRNANT